MEEKTSNKIWSTRLAKTRCVQEVFDLREIVYLFENTFDLRMTTIKLEFKKVQLNPNEFIWLLKLLELNKCLELYVVNSFMKLEGGGIYIVPKLISPTFKVPSHVSLVDISFFGKPFEYFCWHFSRVVGQKSTTNVPKCIFYVLYETYKNNCNFNWADVISNQLVIQLHRLSKNNRLFMMAYLIMFLCKGMCLTVYPVILNSIVLRN